MFSYESVSSFFLKSLNALGLLLYAIISSYPNVVNVLSPLPGNISPSFGGGVNSINSSVILSFFIAFGASALTSSVPNLDFSKGSASAAPYFNVGS